MGAKITLPIPVYVVSLEKDFIRRLMLNVNYDKRFAVNGNALDTDNLIRKGILDTNASNIDGSRKLRTGEIGCYLSHVELINDAIKFKHKYVLIVEDDVLIPKDIDIMNSIYQAPKDFQILFVGYKKYDEKFVNETEYEYDRINDYVIGAHAYIINTENLKNTDMLFPIKLPYDIILPRVYVCYALIPKIAYLNVNSRYSNTTNIY